MKLQMQVHQWCINNLSAPTRRYVAGTDLPDDGEGDAGDANLGEPKAGSRTDNASGDGSGSGRAGDHDATSGSSSGGAYLQREVVNDVLLLARALLGS